MIPDRMRLEDAHCGPVALARVLKTSAEAIMNQWPTKWTNPESDRWCFVWPIDTPWNHEKLLNSMGKSMVEIKGDSGLFPANSIALIHNFKWGRNPITKFLGSLFMQHWIVVLEDDGTNVTVDWGTMSKPVRVLPRGEFLQYINSGWPRCVYTIA